MFVSGSGPGPGPLDGIMQFLAIVGLIAIFCLGFALAILLTGGIW